MKIKSLSLSIGLLLGSVTIAHALTVDELAAQFEAYKKVQDRKFDQLNNENNYLLKFRSSF